MCLREKNIHHGYSIHLFIEDLYLLELRNVNTDNNGMKNKIKILYILHSTLMSGATISFLNMIKGLHQKGVLIYIVHPDEVMNEEFRKESERFVQGYFYVHMRQRIFVKRSFKEVLKRVLFVNFFRLQRETKALEKVIKEVCPDIIHTNSGVIHSGFFAARKAHIPHVWHIREYQTKDFGWNIYPSKGKLIKHLKKSYVITISEDLLRFFDLEGSQNARCIYNGCFERSDTASVFPKDSYFLVCSRVSEEKGHDEIIQAFSVVHKCFSQMKLVIAGFSTGKYLLHLQDLCKKLDCESYVEFVGYQNDVRPLMDKAFALVVASRNEGFGRMTAEAAFRSCMTIGKASGGTKEIIEKIGGLLYTDGSEELAKRMTEVIEMDRKTYKEHVDESRKKAIELFANDKNVSSILAFYDSIIAKQGK